MEQGKWCKILTMGLLLLIWMFCLKIYWPDVTTFGLPEILPAYRAASTSLRLPLLNLTSELVNLTSLLYWPPTPGDPRDFLASTSPQTSTYHLRNRAKDSYAMGGFLEVILVARDHKGRPKHYGGDLFRAQLLGPDLKAAAPGEVEDLKNGVYLLTFPLLWAGQASVHVRLIHSSEAVGVLRRVWREKRATVDFKGYFRGLSGHEEVVTCNVDPQSTNAKGPVCQYTDVDTGEPWFCARPPTLPCDALVGHSSGSYWTVTTPQENALLDCSEYSRGHLVEAPCPEVLKGLQKCNQDAQNTMDCYQIKARKVTDKVLPQGVHPIRVRETDRDKSSRVLAPRHRCLPGLPASKPAGFYYKDVWYSLSCSSHSFSSADSILGCLAGHEVHMIGDSTLRQWWEYLRDTVPSLKPVDLHVTYQTGPLMAVDAARAIVLHWRAHKWPLRSLRTPVASLHSVARELGGLAGGPHTVVVLGLGAHFTTFSPSIFTRRLEGIRAAVVALLAREPSTLVVIKLANTGYKSVYGSDWFTLLLNRLLRTAFRHLPVAFVDAWAMTSSLALPDNIHPDKLIVRNEVDMLLSFICPS